MACFGENRLWHSSQGVCYVITQCVMLSPGCYLTTPVLSYHPCTILPPVCYLVTRVLFYHPRVILSFACYLITRVLFNRPVCYLITLYVILACYTVVLV